MLTKELLEFRIRQDKISPNLLGKSSSELVEYLKQLLALMPGIVGQRLHVFDKKCSEAGLDHHKLYPAMRKLLLSHVEVNEDEGRSEERWQLLLRAQQLRQEVYFPQVQGFQEALAHQEGKAFADLAEELYGDLPENKVVLNYKNLTPQDLIDRYNCAQVQGLLIYADEITIEVSQASLDDKRALFHAIKFHRLVADVHPHSTANGLSITLSGPLSIFKENLQTYGLRLATFFPHVPLLPRWSLSAKISMPHKKKNQLLQLSNKDGINSHYQRKGSYVPEEFMQLIKGFNQQQSDWQISVNGDPLNLGKENYCIPDFVINHGSGVSIYVELFHKWHHHQLGKRLKAAASRPDVNLLIGVCKSIRKRKDIAELLDTSLWFEQNGFEFREFPTIKTLHSMLAAFGRYRGAPQSRGRSGETELCL